MGENERIPLKVILSAEESLIERQRSHLNKRRGFVFDNRTTSVIGN